MGASTSASEMHSWTIMMNKAINDAEAKAERALNLKEATMTPDSFEEAVEWASMSAMASRKDGGPIQSMYFNMQGDDDSVEEEAVDFAEALATELTSADTAVSVRVVFRSAETLARCKNDWEDIPRTALSSLEQVSDDASTLAGATFVLLVAPAADDLQAAWVLRQKLESMSADSGARPTLILINHCFREEAREAFAKDQAKEPLLEGLVNTFHMAQLELVDLEKVPFNPAVVVRAWPKKFSLWEDNPEEFEAIKGFYFVANSGDAPPSDYALLRAMDMSRNRFKTLKDMGKR